MSSKSWMSSYRDFQSEWARAYEQGETLTSISKRYGVDRSTVTRWVKKTTTLRTVSLTPALISKIGTQYAEGKTKRDIARHLSLSVQIVTEILAEHHGIQPRLTPAQQATQTQYEPLICRRYEEGQPLAQIAADLNRSIGFVRNVLLRAGVRRRSFQEASRQYWFDDDYLNQVDDERSYMLGVIWGVGHIRRDERRKTLSIHFAAKQERFALDWMSAFTQPDSARFNYPTKQFKTGPFVLHLFSVQWIHRLDTLGFPGKRCALITSTEAFCESAFWSGYWQVRAHCQQKQRTISISFNTDELALQALSWLQTQGFLPQWWCVVARLKTGGCRIRVVNLEGQRQLLTQFPFLATQMKTAPETWQALLIEHAPQEVLV